MAKSLEEARSRLDDEFGQVRRNIDNIHKRLDEVEKAGPEDDLSGLLEKLEEAVNEVRTGGLMGHGSNGHKRARDEYLKLKQG